MLSQAVAGRKAERMRNIGKRRVSSCRRLLWQSDYGNRRGIDELRAALTFTNGATIKIPESVGGLAMPRRIMLSVFALAVSGMTADAADLPTQSRLGAIFAEPAEVHPAVYRSREVSVPIIPYNLLPNPPWNRGGYYYGSSWSYYNAGPYYGGTFYSARLPYVCGFFGYC
jgi:hypothetical protein